MEVYRISKCPYIEDLSGYGASTYGGRWNSKGKAVLYTAGSISLAMLELLAHIERPPVGNFCRSTISIPDNSIATVSIIELPSFWRENPASDSLKIIGDSFINTAKDIVLKIPSAIVPDEFNYLINPAHRRFSEVSIIEVVNLTLDERLLS